MMELFLPFIKHTYSYKLPSSVLKTKRLVAHAVCLVQYYLD